MSTDETMDDPQPGTLSRFVPDGQVESHLLDTVARTLFTDMYQFSSTLETDDAARTAYSVAERFMAERRRRYGSSAR